MKFVKVHVYWGYDFMYYDYFFIRPMDSEDWEEQITDKIKKRHPKAVNLKFEDQTIFG